MILITGNNSPTFLSEKKVFFCNSKSKRSQNHLWLRPSSCLLQQATFQATTQSAESLWVLSCCGFSNICVLCTERRSRHTRGSFWPEAFGSSRWSTSPQKEFFLRSQVKMRAGRSRRGLNGASQLYFYSETQKVSSPIHTFNKHMAANTGPEK